MRGTAGVFGAVVVEGTLHKGDVVELLEPPTQQILSPRPVRRQR
jgi:MOSC domain-containing protein YiiM